MRTSSQKGAALILVLSLVAILTVLIAELYQLVRHSGDQFYGRFSLNQAQWFADSGVVHGLIKARSLSEQSLVDEDLLSTIYDIEKGRMEINLKPLHGCFNINSLDSVDQSLGKDAPNPDRKLALSIFKRLLTSQSIDKLTANKLSSRLADWIDADKQALDSYGLERASINSPVPANQQLLHLSEIKQLALLSEEQYKRVAPFLCVRPGDVRLAINPNDLDEEDIPLINAVMGDHVNVTFAAQFINAKPASGYSNISEVYENLFFETDVGKSFKPVFSLDRNYFNVVVNVAHDRSRVQLDAVVFANEQKRRVLTRYYGVMP